MERPSWATDDVDLSRPSVARVYDYFLGGSHHFEVDRLMAAELMRSAPDVANVMRSNRSFLRRAVRAMLDAGIEQFLDVGSGIPTVGNVHEIAQQVEPSARVVYVDRDPVAVAHSRAILGDNPYAACVAADLNDPESILAAPESLRLLDPAKPVGLLVVAVLHFVPDSDEPYAALAKLRQPFASGSMLAISHGTYGRPEQGQIEQVYRQASPLVPRTLAEVAAFFGDWELLPPGMTVPGRWRPDAAEWENDPDSVPGLVGVGRKP